MRLLMFKADGGRRLGALRQGSDDEVVEISELADMRALIEAKRQGQEVAEVAHPKLAPVIDLMDALKKSLEKQPAAPAKKPPVRAVPAVAKEIKKTGKKAAG